MPVRAIKAISTSRVRLALKFLFFRGAILTKLQNGVGAFILQCKRLDFHYCDWAGSSKGMKYEEWFTFNSLWIFL